MEEFWQACYNQLTMADDYESQTSIGHGAIHLGEALEGSVTYYQKHVLKNPDVLKNPQVYSEVSPFIPLETAKLISPAEPLGDANVAEVSRLASELSKAKEQYGDDSFEAECVRDELLWARLPQTATEAHRVLKELKGARVVVLETMMRYESANPDKHFFSEYSAERMRHDKTATWIENRDVASDPEMARVLDASSQLSRLVEAVEHRAGLLDDQENYPGLVQEIIADEKVAAKSSRESLASLRDSLKIILSKHGGYIKKDGNTVDEQELDEILIPMIGSSVTASLAQHERCLVIDSMPSWSRYGLHRYPDTSTLLEVRGVGETYDARGRARDSRELVMYVREKADLLQSTKDFDTERRRLAENYAEFDARLGEDTDYFEIPLTYKSRGLTGWEGEAAERLGIKGVDRAAFNDPAVGRSDCIKINLNNAIEIDSEAYVIELHKKNDVRHAIARLEEVGNDPVVSKDTSGKLGAEGHWITIPTPTSDGQNIAHAKINGVDVFISVINVEAERRTDGADIVVRFQEPKLAGLLLEAQKVVKTDMEPDEREIAIYQMIAEKVPMPDQNKPAPENLDKIIAERQRLKRLIDAFMDIKTAGYGRKHDKPTLVTKVVSDQFDKLYSNRIRLLEEESGDKKHVTETTVDLSGVSRSVPTARESSPPEVIAENDENVDELIAKKAAAWDMEQKICVSYRYNQRLVRDRLGRKRVVSDANPPNGQLSNDEILEGLLMLPRDLYVARIYELYYHKPLPKQTGTLITAAMPDRRLHWHGMRPRIKTEEQKFLEREDVGFMMAVWENFNKKINTDVHHRDEEREDEYEKPKIEVEEDYEPAGSYGSLLANLGKQKNS